MKLKDYLLSSIPLFGLYYTPKMMYERKLDDNNFWYFFSAVLHVIYLIIITYIVYSFK